VVFSLHFLLNNPPALSYVHNQCWAVFLEFFFKEPVGSSSSKNPELKKHRFQFFKESRIEETQVPVLQRFQNQRKHGFQFFKDTRIKEFQTQRNTGSSSSMIPGSKKHCFFQFFEQKTAPDLYIMALPNAHLCWVSLPSLP